MQPNLSMVLEQVGKDKGIDKKVLVQTLEQAIMTAAKKVFGLEREMEAQFNEDSGQVDLFQVCIVTDSVDVKGRDIAKVDADRNGLRADIGDELLFQIFYTDGDADKAEEQQRKYGDILDLHDTVKRFGRIAAQTAKQVIIQRIREAERENTFNEYRDRKGELIHGTVRRFERGNIIVDLGKTEAILPVREQVQRENYRIGDRIIAYCVDIEKNARGPQIVLSRASKGLLEKLFEQEVSEIYEKIVRIESSAREPGSRSKIAVSSRDRDVDPVGACVGIKGSRVQAVVQELRGEKIDIVPYSEDPARFVCNAIAPAEVSRVVIDAENHTMELIVPDDKLSLAIGKKGQNVRLASQLTGWRIDIHAESRVREMEQVERQVLAGLDGSSEELSSTLFRLGWRSVSDLAEARIEDLRNVPGVGGEAGAIRLKEAALGFVNEERRKRGEPPLSPSERPARSDLPSSGAARQEAPSRSAPPSRGPQNPLPGIDPDIVARLMDAGYTTLESMEEEDEERLAQAADLTLDEARDVKRRVTRLLTRGNR
ncbi:MAG TPA: transcription termination factor NusA [Pseudomonadota bacterium]|jgi:N utilization substance protein A|nr:transcription termination factor NusA [Pseudomonadota bacterium]HND11740.1 transcription termination factor NusA [Pseudomonadota bacterium]HNF95925.1 transcription termination factor NusA [Pseudomonadota bacterium]HNK44582.1 transcription termination factor NusA [Pseudomonadota bacterium]HNN52216.1 transcription termination factor NusA [Pseudomonadota bacterium]